MRGLGLCVLLIMTWAWPGHAAARVFGDTKVIRLGSPRPDGWQGFYIPLSPPALVHAGFGVAMPLYPRQDVPPDPSQPPDTSTVRSIFHIEIGGGAQFGWNRSASAEKSGFLLTPQIGYTFIADNGRLTHLGRLGLGLGYGNHWAHLDYLPRFVVGVAGDHFAVGVRHGIAAYFVSNLFAAEVGHQMLYVTDHFEHSLHFTININALLVIVALGAMR